MWNARFRKPLNWIWTRRCCGVSPIAKVWGGDAVHALAIAREASNRWVVRADIEDYFERILR